LHCCCFIISPPAAADYDKADAKEPEGDMYARALNMLLPYLLSWRTRLAAADDEHNPPAADELTPADSSPTAGGNSAPGSGQPASASQPTADGSPSAAENISGGGGGVSGPAAAVGQAKPPARKNPELQQLTPGQRRHLAVLLDTALLKVLSDCEPTDAAACRECNL